MPTTPTVTLNNGVEMPQLGFGVFQIAPDEVAGPVRTALDAGYRLIDTAAGYGNEEGVGQAIADSDVPREDIFVTTKLNNDDHAAGNVQGAFDESLRKLGLDRVDLYLIHWPLPSKDLYVDTWRTLERLYAEGRARAIGVSNFTEHHLNRLFAETDVVPALNQVELHPRFDQAPLRAFHADHGIATEAWSPIGQGTGLLEDPTILEVAAATGRTPAQVVLRWHLQLGNVVIPKSATNERISANIDVVDFELDRDQMGMLGGLSGAGRIGPDPETFGA